MASAMTARIVLVLGVALLVGCASTGAPTATLHGSPTKQLDDVLALSKKASDAYAQGRMDEAAKDYQSLTQLVPEDPNYWYLLGNTLVKLQEPDQAVQAYDQAIIRNPRHARAWHNLGVIRLRQSEAAFVSSAETANSGDPLQQASRRIATALMHVSDVPKTSGSVDAQSLAEDVPAAAASTTPAPISSSIESKHPATPAPSGSLP